MPVKYPVLFAIIEFFLYAVAHYKMVIGCYCDITGIKKPMDIRAKEEAIINTIRAIFTERLYVGGFKNRQGLFAGNSTSPLIGVCHDDSETPLPNLGKTSSGSP